MTKAQAVGLALINLLACVVTAAASMQFTWNKWWLPLLLVGGVCALLSSFFLEFIQRKLEESPTRTAVTWTGYVLFAVGILLAVGAFRL